MRNPSRTLEITTVAPCPMRCSYCPQNVLEKAYKGEKTLLLETFKKALDNVPKDIGIHFSGMAEPFANKDTVKMMEYADEQGYKMALYTKLPDKAPDLPFYIKSVHEVVKEKDILSRAGNLWEREPKECFKGHLECHTGNYTNNVMMPNGDVYLCCQDYGLKHKIGNILTTHYDNFNRQSPFELCKFCELSVCKKDEK